MPPTSPPYIMLMLIGRGRCTVISFMIPFLPVEQPHLQNTNFVSRINFYPWIAPLFHFVCLSFPWAKFRRTKGAIKLHLLLDHDGYLPTYAYISNGGKHDATIARKVSLAAGSIVAMDRSYNDYKIFAYWTANRIYFVIRINYQPYERHLAR
ncbi:MAG: transposase [Deltaproteobacteria bacterium]|nr:transposase [Deltaproteobacteria bacterium]